MKLREMTNTKLWAYFAPDGWIQVITIGETKKESRDFLVYGDPTRSYKDFEKLGYVLRKISLSIKILK
jgi:hypothetical protein